MRERGKERESEVDLFPLANLVQNVLNDTLFLNINPSSNYVPCSEKDDQSNED